METMETSTLEKNGQPKYLDGPEQIIPADSFVTTRIDGKVKLRVSHKGVGAEPPISVPGLLRRAASRHPDTHALVSKGPDNEWIAITYKDYLEKVETVAKGFIALGLERHQSVGILGFNSPEWFIADVAAIFAGGIASGIYTTNSPEACQYCLNVSKANIVVVQNQKHLEKILAVKHNLPDLKAIVQWEKPLSKEAQEAGVYSWQDLLKLGKSTSDYQLDLVLQKLAINEVCTLVFTSGTVTNPKAVMLSHDNLTWDAFSISERTADFECPGERLISFLPLSHVAAQLCDIFLSMHNCFTVYFATPDALKGSIVELLVDVRPTRFFTVPRLWEKMHDKMVALSSRDGLVKKGVVAWARSKGLTYHQNAIAGDTTEFFGYRLAKQLVLGKVRAALGLDQCRTFVTAAAPLSAEIKNFFLSFDIPITDVFGMSETSGPHTLSIPPKYKPDSVGRTIEGAETKFDNCPDPRGPGELCMRGRHVFMGYLNEPQLTADAVDKNGWLHSGDIAQMDENEIITITGRIKEILITAGGENVAPVLIEQNILSELPCVGYAVVIGDKRKFLSVLLTLKCQVDMETMAAKDDLDPEVIKWLSNLGCQDKTLSQVVANQHARVMKAIDEGIVRANGHAISQAQKIQKFTVLPQDFSISTGELGPTLKVKRAVVYEKYSCAIEEMYKD